MAKLYVAQIQYPDGHSEVLEDKFKTLDDAKKVAKNIVNQVKYTEQYHGSDVLQADRGKVKYWIMEVENGESKIVFESKK